MEPYGDKGAVCGRYGGTQTTGAGTMQRQEVKKASHAVGAQFRRDPDGQLCILKFLPGVDMYGYVWMRMDTYGYVPGLRMEVNPKTPMRP